MKIAVVYITVSGGRFTSAFAGRFIAGYSEYPAEHPHDLFVVSNGGPPTTEVSAMLTGVPCTLYVRSNDGWDIGGYIDIAKSLGKDHDALVCFGESVYFHRPGWLNRIAECWQHYGEGMYGLFSSNVLRPHLNTTAFVTAPKFLSSYPRQIHDRKERYMFEHGENSFWKWMHMLGRTVRLITWDGCWTPQEWRMPKNILWKGDQTNCLVWCNHSDNYRRMPVLTRIQWSHLADTVAA